MQSAANPRSAIFWGEIFFLLLLTIGAVGIERASHTLAGPARRLEQAAFESREGIPELNRELAVLEKGWSEAVDKQAELQLELEKLALRLAQAPPADLREQRAQLQLGIAWAGRLAARIGADQARLRAVEARIASTREKAGKSLAEAQRQEDLRSDLAAAKFSVPFIVLLYAGAFAGLQLPAGRRLTRRSGPLILSSALALLLILAYERLGFVPIAVGGALAVVLFLYFYSPPAAETET